MNRRVLLETLEDELPRGTIRYSSKVVHIESEGRVKSVHLADGTVIKTKVNVESRMLSDQVIIYAFQATMF